MENLLSDAVLSGEFQRGETVIVDVTNDEIVLQHKEETGEENELEEALPAV